MGPELSIAGTKFNIMPSKIVILVLFGLIIANDTSNCNIFFTFGKPSSFTTKATSSRERIGRDIEAL